MGNFEFDGQKYKSASLHQKEWGASIVAGLNFQGTETILDLGCGDGVLTKQLADRVPQGKILGIDASRGMIETAKELEGYNLSFALQDINVMAFLNEFDLIFSNAALHWVKDHERLLANCYKALKPGGIVRFNFAGDGNCSNFYEVVRAIMNSETYSGYFTDFVWPWYMPRISDYEELINRHEFKESRCWEENADRNFETKDHMVKWIDQPSIVPFLEYLPIEKQFGFRDEVVRRMVDKTIQTDRTFFETFRRINVFARK